MLCQAILDVRQMRRNLEFLHMLSNFEVGSLGYLVTNLVKKLVTNLVMNLVFFFLSPFPVYYEEYTIIRMFKHSGESQTHFMH